MPQPTDGKAGSAQREPLTAVSAMKPNMQPFGFPSPAKQKAHRNGRAFYESLVAWGGIEPPTQGFSILCSTD